MPRRHIDKIDDGGADENDWQNVSRRGTVGRAGHGASNETRANETERNETTGKRLGNEPDTNRNELEATSEARLAGSTNRKDEDEPSSAQLS